MYKKAKIAVFASGNGSNAVNLFNFSKNNSETYYDFSLLVCNNPMAGVLDKLKEKCPILLLNKKQLNDENWLKNELNDVDFIILAGFLLKIPAFLVEAFPGKIINIHPALLPKFGGKGMYGHFVHEAVIKSGEKESGITIHLVDEEYDHGAHLFQAKCAVDENDTPEKLAQKINRLEMLYFPEVVNKYIKENFISS